jgi:hypothetical protein
VLIACRFRQFLLTGLPLILNTLLPNAGDLSLAVGLLASMLGMAAYAVASPFADKQDSLLMLPAQMQTTITMVAGMMMKFVDGDPVGQWCIALLIILTFIPILVFGVYLLWDPDYDAAAALSGDAVVRVLGPFLDRAGKMAKLEKGASSLLGQTEKGVSKVQALTSKAGSVVIDGADATIAEAKEMKANAKKAKLKAVQVAIQLIMNPNLDSVDDMQRLGGESAELVTRVVGKVKPLVEAGSPDKEDIAGMVEALFEVCSGGEAKHNSHIAEMMAVKGLALAGVKKGHAIEKAVCEAVKKIGSPASKFGSFGSFYDAIAPVIHGDVSEEEMMTLCESLGIDKLTVAQALLPALYRKSLALTGLADRIIAATSECFDSAVSSWAEGAFEDAKAAIADCLDGDISQEDLENLLALAVSKVEAASMAATDMLQKALVMVLPGLESQALVTRVLKRVKQALETADGADPAFLGNIKRLCRACTNDETRMTAVFELLHLVGVSFESAATIVLEPLVSSVLLCAGFRSGSVVAVQAATGIKELLKNPTGAKGKIDELMAQCKGILEVELGWMEAMEHLPKLLELTGIDLVQAKLAVLQPALERVWVVVGLDHKAPVLRRVEQSLQALAKAPEEVAGKFTEVHTAMRSLASSVVNAGSAGVVRRVIELLSVFGVPAPEAMPALLSAMLARVLKALGVVDGLVVGACMRTVSRLIDEATQPMRNLQSGGLGAMPAGALRPLMDALAEAVLSLSVLGRAGGAPPPFSLQQALELLQMLGVNAQDALLSVTSGMFLQKALEMAGVPATHDFVKEARGAVLQLANCADDERRRKVALLQTALLSGGNPTRLLASALEELGVSASSMVMVVAPLLAQAALQAVGIPKGHGIMLRVARKARAAVIHARTFEEACGMVGAREAPAAGSTGAGAVASADGAAGAGGAVNSDMGAEAAALAVVTALGISIVAFHAGLKAATAVVNNQAKEAQHPARRFSSHFEETPEATAIQVVKRATGGQCKVAPEEKQTQDQEQHQGHKLKLPPLRAQLPLLRSAPRIVAKHGQSADSEGVVYL